MKKNKTDIKDLLRLPPDSQKEMEQALGRVEDRLRSNVAVDQLHAHEAVSQTVLPHMARWPQVAMLAAAALVIVALWVGAQWQSRYGTLVAVDGTSHWISAGKTFGEHGGVLTLLDGSRVEIRQSSVALLERAADGVRIRLQKGTIVVHAAKQREGHLYVQTKDMMVSVVGTVFIVNAVDAGSRVAVLEGEVHVQQGSTEKRLQQGEESATNPALEKVAVREEVAFSRQALERLALLDQMRNLEANSTQSLSKMSFESFTVRSSEEYDPGPFPLDGRETYRFTGDSFRASVPLVTYIEFAYKVSQSAEQRRSMLAPLPAWVANENFLIQAKAPNGRPTKDQLRQMMRFLLAERFKLAVHFTTQESSAYVLSLIKPGKPGPGIQPHVEGIPCPVGQEEEFQVIDSYPDVYPFRCGSVLYNVAGELAFEGGPRHVKALAMDDLISGRKVTLDQIMPVLVRHGLAGLPLVDQTGLTGNFDFRLEWKKEPAAEIPSLAFSDALRDQLGMKIELSKAPQQVLVIDHLER